MGRNKKKTQKGKAHALPAAAQDVLAERLRHIGGIHLQLQATCPDAHALLLRSCWLQFSIAATGSTDSHEPQRDPAVALFYRAASVTRIKQV